MFRMLTPGPRPGWARVWLRLASYPGHVGGGKSGLVSTVYACANDSGNFSRTSPIMDKLHVVVMRRKNQTRYTACSVAAVFTRRWLPFIMRHKRLHDKDYATTTASSTVTVLVVETNGFLSRDQFSRDQLPPDQLS